MKFYGLADRNKAKIMIVYVNRFYVFSTNVALSILFSNDS